MKILITANIVIQMTYCLYSRHNVRNPDVKPKYINTTLYEVELSDPTLYDSQETLLYTCNNYDEFLDTVTKYMVARHRSYIVEEEEGEDEEYMYSDYPQTMKNMVKKKMDIANKGCCMSFEEDFRDKGETIVIMHTNNITQLTPKYTDPIESIDISELFPERPGKYSDLVAKGSKITTLIQQTQDEWTETTPTMSRSMLKDKLTGQSVAYSDLVGELHKTGDDVHPLWKRYVDT